MNNQANYLKYAGSKESQLGSKRIYLLYKQTNVKVTLNVYLDLCMLRDNCKTGISNCENLKI
jgi:hypothetical protein